MNTFDLLVPNGVEQVHTLLQQHGDDAKLIAGGTALVNLMKQGLVRPAKLISLHRVPGLSDVAIANGVVTIGALASLHQLERHAELNALLPCLRGLFAQLASPRVRSMATLGGAIAHADPNQDLPPLLVALDAHVHVSHAQGKRVLPLASFYQDFYSTALAGNELITAVEFALPAVHQRATYLKFLPRSAEDYATVAVALLLGVEPPAAGAEAARCADCRIVLGSVGPTPLRARAAEDLLLGQPLSDALLRQAGAAAAEIAEPMSDSRGSADYKRAMTALYVERALRQLRVQLPQRPNDAV